MPPITIVNHVIIIIIYTYTNKYNSNCLTTLYTAVTNTLCTGYGETNGLGYISIFWHCLQCIFLEVGNNGVILPLCYNK